MEARGVRFGRGRDLPLEFRRHPPAGPATISLGLVPAHVDDGAVRLQRYPAVEMAAPPRAGIATLPVHRVLRLQTLPPVPARGAPEFRPLIAARSRAGRESPL